MYNKIFVKFRIFFYKNLRIYIYIYLFGLRKKKKKERR